MKPIYIKGGYIALVDDEDYDFINQWQWSAKKQEPEIKQQCKEARARDKAAKEIYGEFANLNFK